MQATVDHVGRFTSYDIGWPASQNDITIFKKSSIWIHRHTFFSDGDYLLADKGYKITPYSIRPFNDNELRSADERRRRTAFNKAHSRARIIVEHTFGLLKGRFPVLKWMPGRKPKECYRIVEALMVLHNLLFMLNDDPKQIPNLDTDDTEADELQTLINDRAEEQEADNDTRDRNVQVEETARNLMRDGRRLRRLLMEQMEDNNIG